MSTVVLLGRLALENLLKKLFNVDELQRFLLDLPDGKLLVERLQARPQSRVQLFHTAVYELTPYHMSAVLFSELLKVAPDRRIEIEQIARAWDYSPVYQNSVRRWLGSSDLFEKDPVDDDGEPISTRGNTTTLTIDTEPSTMSATDLHRIEEVLRKVSGDPHLTIKKIVNGSVRLVLDIEPEAARVLAVLFKSGDLTKLLGYRIISLDEGDTTLLRLFLTYSHDSPAQDQAVLDLADRLRADGIDAWIDQYVAAPAEGWPRWMHRQVEEAKYILLICTETYRRRFEGKEDPGTGKGATWEGLLANQVLYEARTMNEKLIPVLLDGASDEHIPLALRPYTHYRLMAGYDALYRHLTGQPALVAPPLGKVRIMAPVSRGKALPAQAVVSPGLPPEPPAGTQVIINDGEVKRQFNFQGGSHTFNFGKDGS